MQRKKIVFLYTELATYFLACVKALSDQEGVDIHIIRWPVNKEAPFDFNLPESINIYSRTDYANDDQLQRLIQQINPSVIYSSGWMDKGYLKICKHYKKSIPVIVGFDNQWKGTLKQWLAVVVSPFKILNHFSHCWVPGDLQVAYAARLGFSKSNILKGFYCCDVDFFHSQYLANKAQKQTSFPKRFIFVGRYVSYKGIADLWQAFIELQQEQPNQWELWCLGTGDISPVNHPKIKHFGFVQPVDLPKFIAETGIFILPSHFEPWGVVLHEFAAAGFPIICSDEVGARTAFVENNINGSIYPAENITALKDSMRAMINLSEEALNVMSQESVKKALAITPDKWAKQLMSLLCLKS